MIREKNIKCPECSSNKTDKINIGLGQLEDFCLDCGKVFSDKVNKPSHYTSGDIECIDAIRSALTDEEFRGYCKGNVLKYAWREKHKGGDEDLKKIVKYIEFLIGEKDDML
jgi:hypothetical protein